MTSLPPPPASAAPRAHRALHWASFGLFTLVGVDVVSVRPQRPVIRLVARTGASSLRRRWHRVLVQVDLRTDEPVLDVPLLALDDPSRVAAFLNVLRGLPPAERLLQIQGPGAAFLRGDIQLDR